MIRKPPIRAVKMPNDHWAAKICVMVNGVLHTAHGFSSDKKLAKKVARNTKNEVLRGLK